MKKIKKLEDLTYIEQFEERAREIIKKYPIIPIPTEYRNSYNVSLKPFLWVYQAEQDKHDSNKAIFKHPTWGWLYHHEGFNAIDDLTKNSKIRRKYNTVPWGMSMFAAYVVGILKIARVVTVAPNCYVIVKRGITMKQVQEELFLESL